MLDDPTRLTSMPEELIAKYFNEVRLLAVDLDLDFDLLMDETGTDHERSRLRRLEKSAASVHPVPLVCNRHFRIMLLRCVNAKGSADRGCTSTILASRRR